MASSILVGVLIILLETSTISGTCAEHFYDYGTQNVVLEFNFRWVISEQKHVLCFFGSNKIGECYDSFGYICALNSTSTGVYSISTNIDLTGVNVTIITFNSTTSGNYSCSKNTFTENVTKCVQNAVSTTATPTTIRTTPEPEVAKACGAEHVTVWTKANIAVFTYGIIVFVLSIVEIK
ncbi:uncharacterized protein LOC127836617 isoform X2 [Dreissena polymorpha]|uniref:uncharacterized protein LOC127836617 isoform X2 n=1 Tax=Dreissena polymorpha TaxID=45954 RepID=UPI002263D43E|nr:uncharacterized protein LOC127836617 isoform X2 [Dreissena polymorpha]